MEREGREGALWTRQGWTTTSDPKVRHARCKLQDSILSVPPAPSDVCESQPELSKWLAPSVSDCIQ
eukprot:1027885-Rhodomonas_salina.2